MCVEHDQNTTGLVNEEGQVQNGKRRLLLVSLCISFLLYCTVYSIVPYIVEDSMSRGISETGTSLIFAAHPLGMACASAIIVPVTRFVGGLRRVVALGCISSAAITMLIGFVPAIAGEPWGKPSTGDCNSNFMLGLYISLRFFAGAFSALAETGMFVCVSIEFKGNGFAMALASIEFAVGIAAFIGASIGGGLYSLGEIVFGAGGAGVLTIPAIFLGALNALLGVGLFGKYFDIVFPTNEENEETAEAESFFTALWSKLRGHRLAIVWILTATVMSWSAIAGMDPTLPVQLSSVYGYSTGMIGLIFVLPGSVYVLGSLVVGVVVDSWIENCSNQTKKDEVQEDASGPLIPYTPVTNSGQNVKMKIQFLLAGGFTVLSTGFILLGPPLPDNILAGELHWMLWLGLCAIGVGGSISSIPSLPLLLFYTSTLGSQDLDSTLTGCFNGAVSLGSVIGPIIWGVINDKKGFDVMSIWICISSFVAALVYVNMSLYLVFHPPLTYKRRMFMGSSV